MPHTIARHASLDALTWRCIGPPRGGRVVAVAGDPVNKQTFYFGACAGGVWKTTDAGTYWRCVTDGFMTASAIGALAVAPSDSNVIYAGTGETTIRIDVSYGDGVYKSEDAGRSWRHIGLHESRHVGKIVIHPRNPDLAYVAALGEVFGPNETRGVYRTRDGGRSWERVLYRGPDAGCVDLSIDPGNPRVIFAGFWQTRRSFWNISSGGPGSGLFRSMDGGDTWEEISRRPGLPGGILGKIGVAASPARAGRVWALIEAMNEQTGLYRSEDYGESWTMVSGSRDLMHRPWYYTHVHADPCDAETVYVNNLQMWRSTDGGANWSEILTPHGDNHDVWIDPADPKRMVQGNDGGACVSFNGGETWTTVYNQPTAQFYRIAVDDSFPYNVYGTQQDNTAIAVPSATVWGAITLGDCFYPGSGESGFIAVHPEDNNLVFSGAIGSSPGGNGALQRYDRRTNQFSLVNVWPEESTGVAPKDLRYRFAWTYPIVFSPHDSRVMYAGGNRVFRTRDEGMSWEEISPDLSLNDVSRQGHSGGEITRESAGAEVHATCASIAPSPYREGEIWASTDDGLVHVTRDDGGSWTKVTPPEMPALAYVGCVEISGHDADTVYVSATCYKLADYQPYLFRTRDGGFTWESVVGDFPQGEITRVIREDPVQPGLLFVGTETGLFYSPNGGKNWARMKGKFPVTPVYDLKIKGSDLVVGTHGRSFWILDDITPLRALTDGQARTRLIPPRDAIRTKLHFGALRGVRAGTATAIAFGIGGGIHTTDLPDGRKKREYLDVGENPPQGAIVYYWLEEGFEGPVVLTFRDGSGTEIISFASDDEKLGVAKRPTARPGLNRFVWDLRYPGPEPIDKTLAKLGPKPLASEPEAQPGPVAVPGEYAVELTAGSETQSAPLRVLPDPRLATTPDEYARQFALLQALTGAMGRLNACVNRIRRYKRALLGLPDGFAERAKAATAALDSVEGVLVDVFRASPRDVLRHPAGLNDTLLDLLSGVGISDTPPTVPHQEVSRDIIARVDAEIAKVDAIAAGEIAGINRALAEAGVEYVS
ncbi:MAG TPA: glycosyl hydrolase [Acetobacteraceae bacterium]|nr:glycosyl hydrolase [Acetobacteraceae bacterium]